jgi:hypothetical protein
MDKICTVCTFLLYALRPLSKITDIWDYKDIIQAVIIFMGWGGGGGLTTTINTGVATGILAGIPALLFLLAGIKLQFKVKKYDMREVELVFAPDVYPSCRIQEGGVTTYRVGLRTKGKKKVCSRVELVRFRPQNANFLPQPLTPMNMPTTGEGWVEVNPGTTPNQFINVVQWMPEGEIVICYHQQQGNRLWPNMIPVQEYVFTLLVQTRDASSFEEDFIVKVENKELVFREVLSSQVSHKEGSQS